MLHAENDLTTVTSSQPTLSIDHQVEVASVGAVAGLAVGLPLAMCAQGHQEISLAQVEAHSLSPCVIISVATAI